MKLQNLCSIIRFLPRMPALFFWGLFVSSIAFAQAETPRSGSTDRSQESLDQIAQRMLRNEIVPPKDKAAAYPIYQRLLESRNHGGNAIDQMSGTDSLGSYFWRDNNNDVNGPVYRWYDISSTGTTVQFMNYDDGSTLIPLGFQFPYYGTNYTSINVCTNGFLSFTSNWASYSPTRLPTTVEPTGMVALWWGDLLVGQSFASPGAFWVKYQNFGTDTLVVSWFCRKYAASDTLRFQAILVRSGDILLQYNTCTNLATIPPVVGFDNRGGTSGLTISYMDTSWAVAGRSVRISAVTMPTPILPANGAVGVTGSVINLMWTSSNCAVSYDVYGSTLLNMVEAMNPGVVVEDTLFNTYCTMTLIPGQTFYWRVVVRDANGHLLPAPVWSYSTVAIDTTNHSGYVIRDNTNPVDPNRPIYNWIDVNTYQNGAYTNTISFSSYDDGSTKIPIGFRFPYYGTYYDSINVCTNGFLSVSSTSNSRFPSTIPTITEPTGLIALWWGDLYVAPTNTFWVKYFTNRKDTLIVSYFCVKYSNRSDTLRFEAIFSGSGDIQLQYNTCTNPTIIPPNAGFDNPGGLYGYQITRNNPAWAVSGRTARIYNTGTTPTLTSPANGTIGISTGPRATNLAWNNGTYSPSNDVYLSTDSMAVVNLSVNARIQFSYTGTNLATTSLLNTKYYWRVVGHYAYGTYPAITMASPIWSYNTYTPLAGTKTIGFSTTGADYLTFGAADSALAIAGVGNGGVVFQVRPGVYRENVVIPPIPNTSAINQVIFQKQSGIVTIQPPLTAPPCNGVTLKGCSWVTFDGINVTDTTARGTSFVNYGYYVTNSSATQGAQHNTIKNSSITLRKFQGGNISGVMQTTDNVPTSLAGTNSYNRYLNLKINALHGLWLNGNSNYHDSLNEVGSTTAGLSNPNRFIIYSDTTRSPTYFYGISSWYQASQSVHDIDVCNLNAVNIIRGMYFYSPYSEAKVYGNRIYNLTSYTDSSGTLCAVKGIEVVNPGNIPFNIHNNFIYNLNAHGDANGYTVYGVDISGCSNIINNTFLFNPTETTNTTIAVSLQPQSNAIYTVLNNIIVNLGGNLTGGREHVGIGLIYRADQVLNSDYNIFYFPNTSTKLIGYYAHGSHSTLAEWQASENLDLHSMYGDPRFVNTVSPYDLHVQLNQPTLAEGRALPIPSITTDIDGEARSEYSPDIGADEGAFLPTYFSVTRPNGGERFSLGIIDTIRWARSSNYISDSVYVFLNRNYPGGNWDTLFYRIPNTGSVAWPVSAPLTNSARIRIGSIANPVVSDESDSNFIINRSVNFISIDTVNFIVGNPVTFRWYTINFPGDMRFEINRNYPTGNWETILSSVPNTGIYPNTGTVSWTPTRPGGSNCRIRVVSINNSSLGDTCQNSFLLHEYFSFSYPDSTSRFRIGYTDTLRWYPGTYTNNVRIQLQRNLTDTNWVTLFNSIPNTGTVAWTVTNPAATGARMRISMPTLDSTKITTNGTFIIYHPIVYPNGGDTLRIGQQDLIRWQYYNITGLCTLKLNRSYPTGQWTTIAANVPISLGSFPFSPSGATNLARIAIIPNNLRSAADTSDANFTMLPHTLTVIHPDSNQQVIAGIADSIKWSGTFADTVTGVTISLCRYGMDYSRLVRIATGVPTRVGNNVIAWTPDTNYTDSARILIEDINDASTYAWSAQVFRVVPATISVTKPIAGLWKYAGLQDTIVWTSRSSPTVHLTDTVTVEFRATQTNPWQLGYVQPNTGSASWIPPAQGTSNAQIRVRSLRHYPTVTLPGQDTVSGISSMFTVAYWPWSTDPYTANNPVSTTTAWTPSIPYDQQTNFLPPVDLHFGNQTGGHHNPGSVQVSYSSVAMDLPTSNVINRIWNIEPDTENFTGASLTLRFTNSLLPAGITRPDTVTPQLRVFSSDDGGSTWIYVPGSSNCYRDTADHTNNTWKIDVINLNELSKWVVGNGGFRPSIQFPSGGEVLTTGAVYTLRWTRSLLDDSVGVYLNRNYPGATWEMLGGTKSDSLVWTASGTASTTARIRVQSILFPTDCDTSPNNFTIRVPGDFNLQPTPTIPVLSVTYSGGNANLSWTASSGIVTGYKVYRSSTTGHFLPPSGTLRATILAPTTTYQDAGASGHYYYRVTAYNTLSSDIAPVVSPPQMILPPTNVDAVRKK